MAKLVLTGSAPIDLADIEISDLWSHSTSVFQGTTVGVVDTNDTDLVFQGTGFTSYDSHGYATAGTITKLSAVFVGDGTRADWSGLSLDASAFQHTVRTGNSEDFISDLFGGNDRITLNQGGAAVDGFAGNDHITGKGGADFILGGLGNDTLKGGANDDKLAGGLGHDTLFGGAGSDTFVFLDAADSTPASRDTIRDLSDTDDTIDLLGVDADSVTPGNQDFVVVVAFTGTAGQMVLHYDAGHNRTSFTGYTDSDANPDFVFFATGNHETFSNFAT